MSTGKIIFLGIGIVLLAGIVFLIIFFQRSDEELAERVVPQLRFAHMQITNLNAEQADMRMHMVIDNPAPVGINIDSLYYTIFIEGNEVASTTYPDPLQIDASDSTSVSLPLTVYYDQLQSVLDALEEEGRDSVVYSVNATLFTDADIIPGDEFDLEVEKEMPLVRIPEIRVTDIGIEDLDFSGAVIQVETLIMNENVFSFGFENMHYSFQLEDNETLEGHKNEPVQVGAKDTASLRVPVEINFKEMGKGLVDLIREGGELSYDFNLRTELISDTHLLKDSQISLNASGEIREMGEVAREQMNEE